MHVVRYVSAIGLCAWLPCGWPQWDSDPIVVPPGQSQVPPEVLAGENVLRYYSVSSENTSPFFREDRMENQMQ
jgi:hypothetical protein